MKSIADAIERIEQTLGADYRADSGYREEDHPRAANGQFNSGGKAFISKAKANNLMNRMPEVPEEERWLSEYRHKRYGGDPREVTVKSIGMKLGTQTALHDLPNAPRKMNMKMAAHTEVDLSNLYAMQPSVCQAQVADLAENYDSDKNLDDLPYVVKYPDGRCLLMSGTHRAAAQVLRGQSKMLANVVTLKTDPHNPGHTKQVKTEKAK